MLVTAFGGSGSTGAPMTPPSSASLLLPAGPPMPEVVSRLGTLNLLLPVNQSRVTAIGYSSGSTGALALAPVGAQANEGLIRRLVHKVVGGGTGSPRWYQLPGGNGPATAALDVGAPAAHGRLRAGRRHDRRHQQGRPQRQGLRPPDRHPAERAPSLLVSVSRLRPDPSLKVGAAVTKRVSKLGDVLDLSTVEKQALAQYTNDEGNHVLLEVHPAVSAQGL